MRRRSPKMEVLYRKRRLLVAALLNENPWCQLQWDAGCTGRATDVDEIRSRAAGGSILDPDNCQTACRHCHQQKHQNPAEAYARGLTLRSYERPA